MRRSLLSNVRTRSARCSIVTSTPSSPVSTVKVTRKTSPASSSAIAFPPSSTAAALIWSGDPRGPGCTAATNVLRRHLRRGSRRRAAYQRLIYPRGSGREASAPVSRRGFHRPPPSAT